METKWKSTSVNEIDFLRPKPLPENPFREYLTLENVVAFKIMYANVYPT